MHKLPTYLWKNRFDRLYFRRVLSPILRGFFGTREFKRSLQTYDRKVAVQQARPLLIALDGLEMKLMGENEYDFITEGWALVPCGSPACRLLRG